MRARHSTVAVVLVAAALALPVAGQAPTEPETTAFVGVSVIPMDAERVLADHTVVVRGGRIAAMGPSSAIAVPEEARRIDGRGRFLLPGLAEMHGHLPGRSTLERYGEAYLDRVLFLFLANGVTTVRGMLGDPLQLRVRAEIAAGERRGPRLFLAGPSLNGQSVPTVDAAWRAVTDQRAAGYDLLKIHPGIRREVYDEIVRVATAEAIPFAGHVPADVGLERALVSGQSSIDHLDGYLEALVPETADVSGLEPAFFGYHLLDDIDESRIEPLAAATRNAGVWNVPTQILIERRFGGASVDALAAMPAMRYVPEELRQAWIDAARRALAATPDAAGARGARFVAVRRRILRALHEAGAGLLLGADTPQVFNVPGFATVDELEALVAAGLSPYAALEAGTRAPARYFGLEDAFGTVAPGRRADLLLLEASPLEDIANVRRLAGVMAAGRWLSREEIEAGLDRLSVR